MAGVTGSAIAPHRKQQRRIAGVQEAAALYDFCHTRPGLLGRAAEKNSLKKATLHSFAMLGLEVIDYKALELGNLFLEIWVRITKPCRGY